MRALAQRLADGLPLDAAEEVLLTGSVSRGVADDASDVELLLVAPHLPTVATAEHWARAAGVEPTSTWQSPELTYLAGQAQETLIELIWLEASGVDALVTQAFDGDLVDHERLRALEALEHGVPLRGGSHLRVWQARLQTYPDELRERLVRDAVDDWGGYIVTAYTRQIRRNDRYSLNRVVLEVADDVLRLLFALNRRWEPSWKRVPQLVEPLELKPERAGERIESALSVSDPRVAMLTIFELARDAVELVDPELDIGRARAWLDEVVEALR